jgi:WD40 repeat protein
MKRSLGPLAGLLVVSSSCVRQAAPDRTARERAALAAGGFVERGALDFAGAWEHTWSLAFTPDGKYLAAGHLSLFEVATRRKVIEYAVADPDGVNRISISPDGRRIAARGKVTGWHVFELATGRPLPVPPELEADDGLTQRRPAEVPDRAEAVAFRGDGDVLAWASGARVTVFDLGRREVLSTFEHAGGRSLALAFRPAGDLLVSTSAGDVGDGARNAKLWDARSGAELRTLPWSGGFVWAAAFSPDGRLLAVGGEGGVTIWGLRET